MEDRGEVGSAAKPIIEISKRAPLQPALVTGDWQDRLSIRGNPPRAIPNLDNCLTALEFAPEWQDVLSFDTFKQRIIVGPRPTPWSTPPNKEWGDNDDSQFARWLQQHDINASTATANEAVSLHARQHSHDSLQDYLNSLEWDNYPRVDRWLYDYFGTTFNDYSSAVGRAWLISAVNRAFNPGCQADYCIVLEGHEGIKKSTALKSLAGNDWFTDQIPKDYNKEAPISLQGKWIVEFSDLEGLENKHAKVESVKAFLSRTTDRYRPVHGRRAIDVPRRNVWSASTNRDMYLPGETGNRRFWPVHCSYAAAEEVARDRDQLWAEAVLLHQMGERAFLDKDTERLARSEQKKRFEEDPWQEAIMSFLIKRKDVSVGEVLTIVFKKEIGTVTQQDQTRVARCLKALGWEGFRTGGSNSTKRYRPQS